MTKRAIKPETLKTIWRIIGGTAGAAAGGFGGAEFGHNVMPHAIGYEDVPSARTASGTMHGLTGAILGGLAGSGKLPSVVRKVPVTAALGTGGALVGEELIPATMAAMRRSTDAAQNASIPGAIKGLVGSPMGRGVGTGAALAGIGGILSGLTRRQSDEEFKRRRSRYSMMSADTLKLLLPMMIAGGLGGSLLGGGNSAQPK
jgi:hypothetical protein